MRLLYIAVGGALGALARWQLAAWIAPAATFPWGILVVNLSGCLLLGFLFPFSAASNWPAEVRLGAVAGFIGAYTTFSTWADGTVGLLRHGLPTLAFAYLVASLLGGLLCTIAGMALARRVQGAAGAAPSP
jgi:CrcB protein